MNLVPVAPLTTDRRGGDAAKLGAFLRRDLLIALSYRLAFLSDILGLAVQAVLFSFVGRMVDPGRLPSFGGNRISYMQFVVVGIALGGFLQVGLTRMATAVREEQLTGTLEALFMAPVRPVVMQLGMVAYDLLYVPLRTAAFLLLTMVFFGVRFHWEQAGPALAVMLAFIPLVWGLGAMGAAAVMTFRRGMNPMGMAAVFFTMASGAFFPLELLPGWLQAAARLNPVAIAITAMRETLLGGAGWADVVPDLLVLGTLAVMTIGAGMLAFSTALKRERRMGTLGHP